MLDCCKQEEAKATLAEQKTYLANTAAEKLAWALSEQKAVLENNYGEDKRGALTDVQERLLQQAKVSATFLEN